MRAAGDHRARVAAADRLERRADGVGAGGAGGDGVVVRAARAEADRDLAGGHVGNEGGDEERRDAPRALLEQHLELFLEPGEPAHARPNHRADLVGCRGDVEARLFERVLRRGNRELDEAVHAPRFLALDEVAGIEVRNLARDARLEVRGLAERDGADPVFATEERVPGGLPADAECGHHADAGHDDAALRAVLAHGPPSQRPNIRAELCPPSPTDVLIAWRISIERASFGT